MSRSLVAALLALALAHTHGIARAGETVQVENASHATRCAEEDNVYVKFRGDIRRFIVEATHPAYLADLREDNKAPDFTGCDMSADPSYAFTPRRVVLHEDAEYRLVGYTFASFWRPERVPFRVGDKVTTGLHLVQLFRTVESERIEVLVVYPADGYWRLKPLPPRGAPETAYGSSFLIGPFVDGRRPYVALSAIEYVPDKGEFRLGFATGEGSVRVIDASRTRTRLEVRLPLSPSDAPFAALRSMFVSPAMADTAEVALSSASGEQRRLPILDFSAATANDAIFLRASPGNHNRSAPDLRFGEFTR